MFSAGICPTRTRATRGLDVARRVHCFYMRCSTPFFPEESNSRVHAIISRRIAEITAAIHIPPTRAING